MKSRYRIKVMNAIAEQGLAQLGEDYSVAPDEENPHGILVRSSPVVLDDLSALLAVARAGAGVNNIPVDTASERGICVFNTPGANANAVVELVFTMIGTWLRNVYHGIDFCQGLSGLSYEEVNQRVEAKKKQFKGEEMSGKTLAVIGLGKIGVRIANGGSDHQMKTIGFDPFPVMDNIHNLKPEVELARSRADMLSRADYVSIHVPLNKNTQGLVSAEFIASMKPGAILLNFARGPVVAEEAVLTALNSGHLQGYITDFPTPALLAHDNVLVTPHLGASTAESEENCACMAVNSLQEYLTYGNVTHSVNFPNIEAIPTVKVRSRLIVINRDEPGMIGQVSNVLGEHGLNIMSFANKSNGTIGYNIIDCDQPLSEQAEAEIQRCEGVIRTRVIHFKLGCQIEAEKE